MKRCLKVTMIAAALTMAMGTTAFAAGWQQDTVGWWYANDDGSYQQNGWFTDTDGKWYYFDANGYMLANTTTPDGYTVGADGAWVEADADTAAETAVDTASTEVQGVERFCGYYAGVDAYTGFKYELNISFVDANHIQLNHRMDGSYIPGEIIEIQPGVYAYIVDGGQGTLTLEPDGSGLYIDIRYYAKTAQ